ncbi:MAG: Maf family nucleotide pyrophosphatase [Flavobacteriaceae bacterium]
MTKLKYILASASPRRQSLLREMGFSFELRKLNVEEVYSSDLKGSEITDFLALKKSAACEIGENEVLITSDTIVWFDSKPLEKPRSRGEAFEMLMNMSGKQHQVYTSVCVKTSENQFLINDCTKVILKNYDANMINYYLDLEDYKDKAGSYGIQNWFGMTCVDRIEGNYYNVMGLPTEKLYNLLINLEQQVK